MVGPQGLGVGVHSVQGVVQWEDGGSQAAAGVGAGPKMFRTVGGVVGVRWFIRCLILSLGEGTLRQ
ncbi:unnamed protein product [Ectocarpus fasciculatus]